MASPSSAADGVEVAALLLEVALHDEHLARQHGVADRSASAVADERGRPRPRRGRAGRRPTCAARAGTGGAGQAGSRAAAASSRAWVAEPARDAVELGGVGAGRRRGRGPPTARIGQVGGHAVDRAELGGQRGRGGVVVGHAVAVGGVPRRVRLDPVGHAVVALDPRRLGERAVGDLADQVGAERVDARRRRRGGPWRRGRRGPRSTACGRGPWAFSASSRWRRPLNRRPRMAASSRICRSSVARAVEPGGDEAPQRVRARRCGRRPRRAATPAPRGRTGCRRCGRAPARAGRRGRRGARWSSSSAAASRSSGSRWSTSWLWRPTGGRQRSSSADRRRGQQHERQPGRPLGQGVAEGEHGVVGPVQVGEHDDDRTLLGPALDVGDQRAGDLLAGAGRVDALERARLAEEVEQAVGRRGRSRPPRRSGRARRTRSTTGAAGLVGRRCPTGAPKLVRSASATGHHTLASP